MSEPYPKSLLGRGIVYGLFGLAALYLLVVLAGSVFSELYLNESHVPETQKSWCTSQLRSLQDELKSQVSLELEHPFIGDAPLARWQVWTSGWASRMDEASARCVGKGSPGIDSAFRILKTLDNSYSRIITDLKQARVDDTAQIEEFLDQLSSK
ncbi:hypothetical protein KAI87_13215 [Myxococcota bacterium]|nr:hypothetical protein [Myxococcota bacterium]